MNLKEAFTYRQALENNLDSLIAQIEYADVALCDKTDTHYMEGETQVLSTKDNTYKLNQTLDLWASRSTESIFKVLNMLTNSLHELDDAIAIAKASCGDNIDVMISTNKVDRKRLGLLLFAARKKPSETWSETYGYKFNNDGDQVSYRYKVKSVTTIDFDRNKIRKEARKLEDEIQKRSFKIDELMLTIDVDFTPRFRASDTIDDIFDALGE